MEDRDLLSSIFYLLFSAVAAKQEKLLMEGSSTGSAAYAER
jgi:hypothetical protein